jgi:hypothetical protein
MSTGVTFVETIFYFFFLDFFLESGASLTSSRNFAAILMRFAFAWAFRFRMFSALHAAKQLLGIDGDSHDLTPGQHWLGDNHTILVLKPLKARSIVSHPFLYPIV